MMPRHGERLMAALQRGEGLCRALMAHPAYATMNDETKARLVELADEFDYLAAQPLIDLIGRR